MVRKGEPIVVLLVEDDPAHAEIVKRNFESGRIANRLIHVADGQLALDYLKRVNEFKDPEMSPRPGLILLDLRLPKVDGIEVLNKIKADRKLKLIPVVVLTSSKEDNDVLKSYDLGVNSYIRKPVDFDQFVDTVKQIGFYWLLINEQAPK